MLLAGNNELHFKPERLMAAGAVLLLGLGCLLVLRPFISALLWAGVLCFSSWPIYRRLTELVGQRRTLAAILMGLGMALVLVLPFILIGWRLADNVRTFAAAARQALAEGPPPPPNWLAKVPLVGQAAQQFWQDQLGDTAQLWASAKQLIEPVSSWLLKLGLLLSGGLVQIALSVVIAFVMLGQGTSLAERLSAGVEKIGGERGRHLLALAGNTVRGVVYGMLGTALVQALMAGIGFMIAGVPGAGLLALVTFFVSILPLLGTALVWLPAALWLFWHGSTGWAIFMLVWGVGVNGVEYMVKPLLISKGSDMPFLLILFGVLGGAMAFGFIGVFLGPTLLAVGYRLVEEWSSAAGLPRQASESAVPALRSEAVLGGNGDGPEI